MNCLLFRFSQIAKLSTVMCSVSLAACDSDAEPSMVDGSVRMDAGGTRRDGGSDSKSCQPSGTACPSVDWSPDTGDSWECMVDTADAVNVVEDGRLEFGDAPEHLIAFEPPAAGSYRIRAMAPQRCGVSIRNNDGMLHNPGLCPAPGSTADFDGLYLDDMGMEVTLDAGSRLLILVGCPGFANPEVGVFTLFIDRV